MFKLTQFLEKFKKIGFDKESQKIIIIDILKSFSIPVENVSIKNRVAIIKASSVVKNQIYIKKADILKKLNNIDDII